MPQREDMRYEANGAAEALHRRGVLTTLGAAGLAAVAGCGGSENAQTTSPTVSQTTSTRPTTESVATTTDDRSVSTTEHPETSTQQTTVADTVLDRTFRQPVAPPAPSEAQYNPRSAHPVWTPGENMVRFDLLRQSMVDMSWQPEIVETWNYRLGVVDLKFYDDHYWAATTPDDDSPRNVTAQDWITQYKLSLYSFAIWPYIEDVQQKGTHELTVFFDDTYRQDFILRRTLHGSPPENTAAFRSWLDRFNDATSEEEREAIDDTLYNYTESNPNPFINIPFKVTGATETSWILELRDDEDPTPRWVDETNFRRLEFVVSAEPARARQGFVNGDIPFAGTGQGGVGMVDADVDFETAVIDTPVRWSPGAYGFNFGKPPASNVHFRRAFAYMLNRQKHATRFMEVDEIPTGLMTPALENEFVDTAVLEGAARYGYDAVLTDLADAEMKAGGYERNSEGNWVYKEGDRAGQPMTFRIPTYPSMQRHANNATAFKNAMNDWGIAISTEFRPNPVLWDDIGDGDFEIALAHWGGGTPNTALDNAFYSSDNGAIPIWEYPGQWEGPPLGESATPPADAPDDTVSYSVASLLQRLQISRDPQQNKELVTKVCWVFNQSLPLIPIGYEPNVYVLNTDAWDWPIPPAEHPFAWNAQPMERIYNRGVVKAVPE